VSDDHGQSWAIVKAWNLDVLEHIALENRPCANDISPPVAV